MNRKRALVWASATFLLVATTVATVLLVAVPRLTEAHRSMLLVNTRVLAQIVAKSNDAIVIEASSKAFLGNIAFIKATTDLQDFHGDAISLCIVAKHRSEFLPKLALPEEAVKNLNAYLELVEQTLEPTTELNIGIGVAKPCLNPL